MSYSKKITQTVAAFALAGLAGCASSPDANFYLLSASQSQPLANWGEDSPNVLIRPINIPAHLKRPEVVYRSDDNRVLINEYDRWAETVDKSIANILSENLMTSLGSERIYTPDASFATRPDIIVRIDIKQFGLMDDGQVALVATWETEDKKHGTKQLHTQSFQTAPRSEIVSHVVEAMSDTVRQLSTSVSENLIELKISRPDGSNS